MKWVNKKILVVERAKKLEHLYLQEGTIHKQSSRGAGISDLEA